jgi:hypothetical protein
MQTYDVVLDVDYWFGEINANNKKEALLKALDSLKELINNEEEFKERKYINEESGSVNYEFKITEEHPEEEGYYKRSDSHVTFDLWDKNDYSYLVGKPYKDFSGYEIFSPELSDDGILRRSAYADCECCGIIKHRKDMYSFDEEFDTKKGRWITKDYQWKRKVEELGLNFDYLDTYSDVCFDCVDNKKYMAEYERIKSIYEKE